MGAISGRLSRWRMIPRKIKDGELLPLPPAIRRILGARAIIHFETRFHLSVVEGMMDGELPLRLQLRMLNIRRAGGMSLHLVLILHLDQTLPPNVLKSIVKAKSNLLPLILNNLVNINKPLTDKNP